MFKTTLYTKPKQSCFLTQNSHVEFSFQEYLIFSLFLTYFIFSISPNFIFSLRGIIYDPILKTLDFQSLISSISDYKIIYELFQSNFTECNTCNFFPRTKNKTSSPDDLTVTCLFGNQTFNVVNWVRTLKSSGCKSKILIFHDKYYISFLSEGEITMLKECGVVFCSLQITFETNFNRIRFLPITIFLEAYGNYFNHVMINDAFDTVFQKDPFIPQIPNDKIVVSIERVQFGNHEWNMKFLQSTDPNWSFDFYRTKWILNAGFFIGPSNAMLEFLHSMNSINNSYELNDQSILNYLYYRNITNTIKVDFQGEYYISACYSTFLLDSDFKGFMHEADFQNQIPAVIHQFDRICPVAQNLQKICPRMGHWHKYPRGRINIFYMQPCDKVYNFNHPPILNENTYVSYDAK